MTDVLAPETALQPPAAPFAPPPEGEGTIEALVQAELALEAPPRPGDRPWLKHPPGDLFGLALSGGGIRSATFNLGLLQGLQEMRVLSAFDYLSTVSGGGYLGAFWTAWRHRETNREGLFPADESARHAEPDEVRHLREFSNFLSPRLGIFSYDTGRLLVTGLGSMLPSMLAALSVLAIAILAWTALAWGLFSPLVPDWGGTLLMGAGTLVALVGFELAWLRRREPNDAAAHVVASAVGLLLTLGAWLALERWWLPPDAYVNTQTLPSLRYEQPWTDWWYVMAPSAAWAGALLVLLVGRWLFSGDAGTPKGLRFRGAADRVRSRLLLLAGGWTAFALFWYAGVLLEHGLGTWNPQVSVPGLGGLTAALAAAFAKVHHLLSRQKSGGTGGKLMARLKPVLPQLLAYAVVALMVLGVVGLIVAAERPGGLVFAPVHVGGAAVVVVGLVLLFMDPNEVGLHSFYRARLVRAYAGASNARQVTVVREKTVKTPLPSRGGPAGAPRRWWRRWRHGERVVTEAGTAYAVTPRKTRVTAASENRETEVVDGDDVPLDRLGNGAARPFHLVCCAANDLASKDAMAGLYRGAESAVLSKVGCSVNGSWAAWEGYRNVPTLGGAMTASGAAFNTLMGSRSIQLGPAVTFLMAALNLRLGLWVPNPGGLCQRERFALPGTAFFREMFGMANTTSGYVHLSDGGHFENLAVYELVRRHCRVIVASDCGMDTDSAFDDLGNLVRRVREDFGVEIRVDTRPLKPGADGLSRQHLVAGDIHYPDGDTGVLLLFKPALVGDEPADVAQYRRRNAVFPNESTGDQFYDEAQWESYRRLGRHAAHEAFRAVLANLDGPEAGNERWFYTEAFARARREWQPRPEGFAQRLSRFTDRVAELDGLLRQDGCDVLLRQVYKELDELNHRRLHLGDLSLFPGVPGLPAATAPAGGAAATAVARVPAGDAADGRGPGADAEELPQALAVIRRTLERVAEMFPDEHGRRGPAASDAVAAAAQARGVPGPAELSVSLYLIRRALLVMAEIFESERLEGNFGHPLYLGVMNWIARWAYAPLFRMWWPLLKTMYPEPFTRFLETHFDLVSIERVKSSKPMVPDERAFTGIELGGQGFASTCWALAGKKVPENRLVISYNLKMVYEFRPQYRIQAAQLIAQREGGVLVWCVDDFFVPPGLWGVGIGNDFLATLRDARNYTLVDRNVDPPMPLDDLTHLVVKVENNPRTGPGARKKAADEMQLYRTAGFCEVNLSPLGWLTIDGAQVRLPAGWAVGDLPHTQWMAVAVTPKTPAPPAAEDAAKGWPELEPA